MAVACEEISYGKFLAIFGESDEENDEALDADTRTSMKILLCAIRAIQRREKPVKTKPKKMDGTTRAI